MSARWRMRRWIGRLLLGALLAHTHAHASDVADATVDTAEERTGAVTAKPTQPAAGTNIVGEREAAVGLFLLPWQEEAADTQDHPPGLYDVSLDPLDVAGYQRWLDYEQARAQYRRERLHRTH